MAAKESAFQTALIRKLRSTFPGCIILKNDANYLQCVPDLLMLWMNKWAALECKNSRLAKVQPHQEYYIDLMDGMSFAAIVHPGNWFEVISELQLAFRLAGTARISQRQQASLDKLRPRQTV
jgi:hypothetical protein